MPTHRRLALIAVLAVASAVWMRYGLDSPASYFPRVALAIESPPPAIPLPASGEGSPVPARELVGSRWRTDPEPVVQEFGRWTQRYLDAPPAQRAPLLQEGIALAQQRRQVLGTWIREAPQRALAAAVPVMIRRDLPGEVEALLEERISGPGDLSLIAATPRPGGTVPRSIFRRALVNDREFDAFAYGRRHRIPSLVNVSIFGIALDGALAVSDSPVRLLEPGEPAAGRPVRASCPVSLKAIPAPPPEAGFNLDPAAPVAIEVNGQIELLCGSPHLCRNREAELIQAESGTSEHILGNNLPGTSGVTGRPAMSWTHGSKKLLVIRVDFSDRPGVPLNPYDGNAPITDTYAVAAIHAPNGVRDFYEQNSFGATSIQIAAAVGGDSPDVTAVLRMPNTASHYATGYRVLDLHDNARSAASAAGFDLDAYDRIGVVFADLSKLTGSQFTFGGLGSIESKNFWVNGWWSFELVTHEIGHNYGLHHANLWTVPGNSPIDSAGSSVAYEDVFDVMGKGNSPAHHFSHWNKSLLHWIPDTATQTITSGGTFRLHRFDHADANPANSLALKIVRNGTHDYWIGYRRGTSNASLNGGAYVLWGYNESREGDLLDLTFPLNDTSAAGLPINTTLADPLHGISFRPTAQGGSGGADEWLDVAVTLQPRISWSQATYLADEQSGSATLTLRRENSDAGLISVDYATSDGTATAPADYTAQSGTVTWGHGDLEPKTISIPLVPDALIEGAESFSVTLSSPAGGAVLVDSVATVTLVDPGTRDPLFVPDFINNRVEKVLVLPDGDIIAAGWFSALQDANSKPVLRGGIARFNADGSIDPDFGAGSGTGGAGNPIYALARQPDGKLLVGGDFTTMHGVTRNRIARLEADGSLDLTFDPGSGANNVIEVILLQPDGKIVIGGSFTTYNGTAREYLARLQADGSLDTSFTGPNFAETNGWRVSSLALQPNGRLLVGGAFYLSATAPFRSGLCRILADGALDSSFNGVTSGAHTVGNTSVLRRVRDIEVQPDGKILIAGDFTAFNGSTRGGLARLNSNGGLDTAFAPTSNGSCFTVLPQPDGKLLVGGSFTTFNGVSAARLVRLHGSGSLDPSFPAAAGPNDSVYSLAWQPDGKVVLGSDVASYQEADSSSPLWRFVAGLTTLPGTLQFSSMASTGFEGTDLTVTVTRNGGSAGELVVGYSTVPGTATVADFTSTAGTLFWANGDSAPKTFSVPLLSDATLDSGESFFVNLGEPLLNGAILGSNQRMEITPMDSVTFAAWQQQSFSAAELLDPDISGPGADPDQDGWTNSKEYAFGLLPKSPDVLPPFTSQIIQDGASRYLALIFKRRISSLDLDIKVQTSAGLTSPWLDDDAVQVGPASDNGDDTETVTFRDSQPVENGSSRFMRLEIEVLP